MLDIAGGWAWGRCLHDDYVGYLPAAMLAPVAAATHRVTAALALAFAAPDIKSAVTAQWPLGARLTAEGSAGDFVRCGEGYVHRRHVDADRRDGGRPGRRGRTAARPALSLGRARRRRHRLFGAGPARAGARRYRRAARQRSPAHARDGGGGRRAAAAWRSRLPARPCRADGGRRSACSTPTRTGWRLRSSRWPTCSPASPPPGSTHAGFSHDHHRLHRWRRGHHRTRDPRAAGGARRSRAADPLRGQAQRMRRRGARR